jgi:hypothetical protein
MNALDNCEQSRKVGWSACTASNLQRWQVAALVAVDRPLRAKFPVRAERLHPQCRANVRRSCRCLLTRLC